MTGAIEGTRIQGRARQRLTGVAAIREAAGSCPGVARPQNTGHTTLALTGH